MARPSGKPKRCLTAYNIFFQEERQRLLKTLPARSGVKSKKAHGKIGFAELGRTISRNWKNITPQQKVYYRELAKQDKKRYLREMEEWKALLAERETDCEASVPKQRSSRQNQTPVVTGSVPMDDDFVPASQPSSVDVVQPQDMICMPTEDLVDLAVTDTSGFAFDTAIGPAPTQIEPIPASSPHPADNQAGLTMAEKTVASDLTQGLDEDCQDFLVAAFT